MSIEYDRLEFICKRMTCSELELVSSRTVYADLCQVHAELDSRVSVMADQIKNRADPADTEWRKKVGIAISTMSAKREIVRRRLADIRESTVAALVTRLGGRGDLSRQADTTIVTRCLLNIIDNYCNFGWLPEPEQIAIDVARNLSGYSASPVSSSPLPVASPSSLMTHEVA